jgi:protein-disulfide isomerase
VKTTNKKPRSWAALLLVLALTASACGSEGATETTDDPPGDNTTQSTADPEAAATETTAAPEQTTTTSAPAGSYDGLQAGFTEEGYPYLGDPDAPITLVEFSDYLCPFCGRHFTETNPQLLEQYVRSGQVNLVFRDFPLADLHPNAPSGHAAALCIAEQGADLFWAYHDALFARQSEWSDLADTGLYLSDLAGEIGADRGAYLSCIESGRTDILVEQSVAAGRQFGFSGTPSFHIVDNRTDEIFELVGAQPLDTFTTALDAAISGEVPVADDEQPADTPELPLWANADGLAPDPARPGYNLAGDAYRGDPEAPVVVIEISDFQCPFCRRHALETQPALDDQYVDTGRVMWVFKHLPLQIHPQAPAAAAAAECAGAQGAFWEMHDLLFETVEEWAVDPPDTALTGLAAQLGLDEAEFASCVGGRTALESVLADLYDLTGIFASTPTFVVLHEGQPSVIEGAQPLEQFMATLDGLLDG